MRNLAAKPRSWRRGRRWSRGGSEEFEDAGRVRGYLYQNGKREERGGER